MTTDQLLAVGVLCNAVAFMIHGVWHALDARVAKRAAHRAAHPDRSDYGPGPEDVDDSPEYHAARRDDGIALDAMAANERMGAALAYIYREEPEWKERVSAYLADYPFEWQPVDPVAPDDSRATPDA